MSIGAEVFFFIGRPRRSCGREDLFVGEVVEVR